MISDNYFCRLTTITLAGSARPDGVCKASAPGGVDGAVVGVVEGGPRAPLTLVADAFYACRMLSLGLLASGSHLVSRVRKNAVVYRLVQRHPRRRGRPRFYGSKIRLRSLFDDPSAGSKPRAPSTGSAA